MTNPIDTFFAAWSVADENARLTQIAATLAEASSYTDPRTPAPMTSAAEISNYVGMFVAAAPGTTATVVKSDTLHGMTRATVEFKMADGMVQHGQYFVEHRGDRIMRMAGFVGTGSPE